MTIKEKIDKCDENLASYRDMLSKMPEDTLIGRLCIQSYIKREEKRKAALLKQLVERK